MVNQGLDISQRQRGLQLDIKGMVMDSCPGEKPKFTVAKATAINIAYWVSCRRDGMSYPDAVTAEARLIKVRLLDCHFSKKELNLLQTNDPLLSKYPGHIQEQLSQTLIVRLLKVHLFSCSKN